GLAIHPGTRDAFLTAGNFSNLTAQISEIVIIGVGMTLVILIGGIDLSVGAGIALTGVVAAKLQIDHHQPAWVACAGALAVAGVIGLWHGLLVTRGRMPAFVATLGGFLAYRGLGLVLSDARGLSPMAPDFQRLGARLPAAATIVAIYALTGRLTACAGIAAAARTNGVTPGNAGLMRELHVITAVVIGGTSLSGGRATIIGTVVGALVFGTLSNGMNLMNVNSNWQLIFTGAILVGASLLDSLTNKKRTS